MANLHKGINFNENCLWITRYVFSLRYKAKQGSAVRELTLLFSGSRSLNLFLTVTGISRLCMIGTLFLRFWFMLTTFRTYKRDVNPFETDTEGRLFVVDVSINWLTNRNWQTKVPDSWKVTQMILLRRRNV